MLQMGQPTTEEMVEEEEAVEASLEASPSADVRYIKSGFTRIEASVFSKTLLVTSILEGTMRTFDLLQC